MSGERVPRMMQSISFASQPASAREGLERGLAREIASQDHAPSFGT